MAPAIFNIRHDPATAVTELLMARSQRHQATYLWVEGADDKSVLQQYRRQNCQIVVAGKKATVLSIASEAKKRGVSQGFLCLIDADYSRFLPPEQREPIPPRVAQVPHHPDIEGSIYFHHGDAVLQRVFAHEHMENVPWICKQRSATSPTLDALVEGALHPIGALRVAWRRCGFASRSIDPHEFADRPRNTGHSLVCGYLQYLESRGGATTDPAIDIRHLIPAVSEDEWHVLRRTTLNVIRDSSDDPWSVVRGKDLSVALGWLAYQFPKAVLHPRTDLSKCVELIQQSMLGATDRDWLQQSGLLDAFIAQLSPQENIDTFLVSNSQKSAAA